MPLKILAKSQEMPALRECKEAKKWFKSEKIKKAKKFKKDEVQQKDVRYQE